MANLEIRVGFLVKTLVKALVSVPRVTACFRYTYR